MKIKQKDSISNPNTEYKAFISKRSNSLPDDLIKYNNIMEKLNKDAYSFKINNFCIKLLLIITKNFIQIEIILI